MEGLSTVLLSLALVAGIGALVLPAMPQLKGRIGEWLVHRRLRSALPASHYTVFHDVKIRCADSEKSGVVRLDHVVVSPYGVFVIRSRHWSGWLFGGERDEEWSRVRFRSTRRVANPLRQNDKGIAALQKVLELDPALFHSLVVLTGAAEFRTPMPASVTRLGGMMPFIQVRSHPNLGYDAAPQVAQRIESLRLSPGPQTRAARIVELRRSQGARFSARQATTALACMLAMVSVAGLLIQNLAEVPGRYPTTATVTPSPFVDDAPPPRIDLPGRSAASAATARSAATDDESDDPDLAPAGEPLTALAAASPGSADSER